MRQQYGFTLIEMLLSVMIITVLAMLSIPVFNAFATRDDLDVADHQVASTFRRAQTYARGINGDSPWSVNIQPGIVTLYKGTTFASRDTSYDESVSIPGSISVSGLNTVQFAKSTGIPNSTGTVTLMNNNNTRTITINAKGMVDY
jgi:prepilin-type N-terminal cleavage/methylation domain-containing protein